MMLLADPTIVDLARRDLAHYIASERIINFLQWAAGLREAHDYGDFVRGVLEDMDKRLLGV
jgi:hypothetical protein